MLPAGRPATSWVYYTTSCNTQSWAPEDGRDHRPKHVEPIGIRRSKPGYQTVRVTHTRYHIDKIESPDDEHLNARKM